MNRKNETTENEGGRERAGARETETLDKAAAWSEGRGIWGFGVGIKAVMWRIDSVRWCVPT